MFQVVKRDGEIDNFRIDKITKAIKKAYDATEKQFSDDMLDMLALHVTSDFQKKIKKGKISVEDIQDSVENVLIQEKLPKYVEAKPFDIQVLTPMRKGLLGVERLNQILQRYLNPPDASKKERENAHGLFREGDKVMQIRNNYQMEWEIRGLYGIPIEKGIGVFNGDTGILRTINDFAETAEVEFEDGRWAEYSFKQLDELELAYAITIHKSQGSEYPAVVIPLLSGPRMLLNRNLLYTAVTRARKCVTVVGSEETFREMIRNEKQQQRYSSLDRRICETEE